MWGCNGVSKFSSHDYTTYDAPIIALAAILGGKKRWWSMQEWSETKENSLSKASLDDLALSKAS